MKKPLLLSICLIVTFISTQAQTLIGTLPSGGSDNGGVINRLVIPANELSVVKSFQSLDKNPYNTNLIKASDGKLYGMTFGGGFYGYGVIFSYDPASGVYTRLKSFDKADGSMPYGSLLQASDGKLYGMTEQGGTNGEGVIFSFDITSNTYTKLFDFNNNDFPYGSFIQGKDGKLYALSSNGGFASSGYIFSFDPATRTIKDLYDMNFGNSHGSLIQATNGKLYGLATGGIASGHNGFIFSFDPSDSVYAELKDLADSDGDNPNGSLFHASNGKLYGTTENGGGHGLGVIFSYDPVTSIYHKERDLTTADGTNPSGNLVQAANGLLYGTTYAGGNYGAGTIFTLDTSGSSFNKVADFNITDGGYSYSSLFVDQSGEMYGLTTSGGNNAKSGVIYSFNDTTNTITKLKDFASNSQGTTTAGALLKASNGLLYGMTTYGGGNGFGVIFLLDPATLNYVKLKDFTGTDGGNPMGSLMQATDGKFYGSTSAGGLYNFGVIFSYDPVLNVYTKLHDFNSTQGANPVCTLVQATDGKLYGVTPEGANDPEVKYGDPGLIFSFDPASLAFTDLVQFYGMNGTNPYASLLQARNGLLYGSASERGGTGSNGFGNIFSLEPGSAQLNIVKQFLGSEGGDPVSALIQDTTGFIYGTTVNAGNNNNGVIFSLDSLGNNYKVIHAFNFTDGANPYGNLYRASNGKIYGTTTAGGSDSSGVIFSYDPADSSYTKLIDLDTATGNAYFNYLNFQVPAYNYGFVEVPDAGVLPVNLISFNGKHSGTANQLTWKVANEQNIQYYELQRSITGQNFVEVSRLQSNTANGSYVYTDRLTGFIIPIYYYRLKSVDYDGKFTYSNIIALTEDNNTSVIKLFPNPSKAMIYVQLPGTFAGKTFISITGQNGETLKQQVVAGGNSIVSIGILELASGVYNITISSGNTKQTLQFIKQ